MEDFDSKKKILLGIKKKILHMPNNIQKVNITESFVQLLGYYQETNNLSIEDLDEVNIEREFTDKYERKIISATQRQIEEVANLAPYIYDKFNSIIDEYKKNGFCSYEFELYQKINPKKGYRLVDDFFKFLGDDVRSLYHKIVIDGNFSTINCADYLGVSMNPIPIDNPCMIVRSLEEYLTYYFTIAHEMGHCYQFYLQRNHPRIETFNPYTEITSILFEKMFAYFLDKNYEFPKALADYGIEEKIYFLNDLASSKVLCELFMNNDINHIDANNLCYECNVPLFELRKKMIKDCGYIMANKLYLELTEFHYAFGEIIASYFMNKMDSDFQSAWKEYKNFICTVNDYPLKEILDKYMDVDLMKNNIKAFIKSYRSR